MTCDVVTEGIWKTSCLTKFRIRHVSDVTEFPAIWVTRSQTPNGFLQDLLDVRLSSGTHQHRHLSSRKTNEPRRSNLECKSAMELVMSTSTVTRRKKGLRHAVGSLRLGHDFDFICSAHRSNLTIRAYIFTGLTVIIANPRDAPCG